MDAEYIGKTILIERKEKRILVIGDLHLGYEEVLNKSGVLVGRQLFDEMISDLEKVFEKIINVKSNEGVGDNYKICEDGRRGKIVDKIVLIGDVKHDFGEINRQEWSDVMRLFEYLEDKCKELIVIKGNHDNMLQGIANQRDIKIKDYYILGDVGFLHGHRDFKELWTDSVKTFVMGHIHPAVKLKDSVKVEKYKCFLEGEYKGKKIILVPSFSEYSTGTDVREVDEVWLWNFDLNRFKVKIVSDEGNVLDFGKLGELD